MKKSLKVPLILAIVAILFLPYKAIAFEGGMPENSIARKACQLKMDQQKLWIDHVLLTRNYIISDIASLEDKTVVTQALMENQEDIGNLFKSYYGDEFGNNLTTLLKQHIDIAGKLVDAAKAGNSDDVKKLNDEWHQNADKISKLIASANPDLKEDVIRDMFYKHLDLTIKETEARINKDWEADLTAYQLGEDHIVKFADMLSDGIIKQFAKKFK